MGNLLDLFVFKYNRTDFHELNLDWVISDLKTIAETLKNFISLNTIKYADPIQWNIATQYEANTVVVDPATGTAYLSTKPVPCGVALTNADYWTVIFDLDIATANNNITLRDDSNNVLSTFTSDVNDWLLWNGTLYKVTRTIGLSQAYVPGYNIERFTVELFVREYIAELSTIIGSLDDLTTTDKTNIVAAVNELVTLYDALNLSVGDLAELTTTDKTSVVAAVNEVNDRIDNLNSSIYINVKDYGAIGDGVTDDTTAIMAALAVINANGGVLYFPNGEYLITQTIQLTHDGSTIKGESSQGVYIIKSTDGVCVECGDPNTQTRSLRIEDIAIQCTATTVTSSNCGIFFNNSVNGTINNVIVNNFLVGIRFTSSGNAFVTDIGIVSARSGAIGYDVGDGSVSNSFTNVWAGFNGAAADTAIGFLMIAGNIADVTINYLDVANGAYGLRVDGNGSAVFPPADIRFNNIVCDGQRTAGIYISNINERGNIVINGGWINVLPSANVNSILLTACKNITIADMTLQQVDTNSPQYTAIAGSGCENIIISDTNFINTRICVTFASVEGLKVKGCSMKLYDNNTSDAPAVFCSNMTNSIINENLIDDYQYSISIGSGNVVIIKNNLVHGSVSAPLTTTAISDNLTI